MKKSISTVVALLILNTQTDGILGALGPAWTRGEIEKPAGEKVMGKWKAAVYTAEQQTRLGINEHGFPAKQARDCAIDESKNPISQITGFSMCEEDFHCKGDRFCGVGGICHGPSNCSKDDEIKDQKTHVDPFTVESLLEERASDKSSKKFLNENSEESKLWHEKLWAAVEDLLAEEDPKKRDVLHEKIEKYMEEIARLEEEKKMIKEQIDDAKNLEKEIDKQITICLMDDDEEIDIAEHEKDKEIQEGMSKYAVEKALSNLDNIVQKLHEKQQEAAKNKKEMEEKLKKETEKVTELKKKAVIELKRPLIAVEIKKIEEPMVVCGCGWHEAHRRLEVIKEVEVQTITKCNKVKEVVTKAFEKKCTKKIEPKIKELIPIEVVRVIEKPIICMRPPPPPKPVLIKCGNFHPPRTFQPPMPLAPVETALNKIAAKFGGALPTFKRNRHSFMPDFSKFNFSVKKPSFMNFDLVSAETEETPEDNLEQLFAETPEDDMENLFYGPQESFDQDEDVENLNLADDDYDSFLTDLSSEEKEGNANANIQMNEISEAKIQMNEQTSVPTHPSSSSSDFMNMYDDSDDKLLQSFEHKMF